MADNNYVNLPIPAPPRTQALSSTTFTLPPLDGSLTLPEIYDFHLQHSPNHPAFIYADAPGSTRTILLNEVIRGLHRAGRIVRSCITGENMELPHGRPIIAILALAGILCFNPS
jgi:hypothetical protein